MLQEMNGIGEEFHLCSSKILDGYDLSFREAYELMLSIMDSRLTPVQVASLLSSLRLKGETPQEIGGFSQAMLERANRISYKGNLPLIDIVGTGGAPFKTFNVSTTTALILPTVGIAVAKHGNRSSTSKSGSADLLESLGVNIEMSPETSEKCLNRIDLTFMFAPKFHPAMKNVVPIRKELGFRTIFNLLGPLTNPCGVKRQLTGVYDPRLMEGIAKSLQQRGFERVSLVHSNLGADEITNSGTTLVVELENDQISRYTVSSKDFGVKESRPEMIVNLPAEKASIECARVLSGKSGPYRDFVVVNGAMALRVAGKIENLKDGAAVIEETLDSGKGIDILEHFVRQSGGSEERLNEVLEQR